MDINSSGLSKRVLPIVVGSLSLAWLGGCKHSIEVAPIEVRPIHATLDINLKVDRELDEFFDDVASSASTTTPATSPATTAPAATPTTTAPVSGSAGGSS